MCQILCPPFSPPFLPPDKSPKPEEGLQGWTKQGEKERERHWEGREQSRYAQGCSAPAEKYGSRQGNEAQWTEEAIRLFSVFKRVLNMALSGMVNLLMPVVFAIVLREMFTAVFHGDCVLDGTKGGIALAYWENVHCKIYWNIKRFI